jgi:hypothetical protein
MFLTLLYPRSQLTVDLSSLTESEHHALLANEHRRHSPPWIYVLCVLWLVLMFTFGISNMLPPRRSISHYVRLPNRFFRWAPGKKEFDLEWEVKQNIRKGEERQRRLFGEGVAVAPERVSNGVKGKEKTQVEDVELRILTPLERSFPR